ncbi:MAG: hypothetical protein DIU63_09615 [Proteobacteria bacterium]|nr:MAG: hypothetical protein DIU63_09615 [Pseudomonadota bacterium]
MLRYVNVMVHRHELHKQPVTVPAWEVPLLESLYAGGVEVQGEVLVNRPAPDPEAEYDRLERKYREYRDEAGDFTGESVVGAVYGRFAQGRNALAKAISSAVVEDESIEALREEAEALGISVDRRWGAERLRREIASRREAA